MHVCQLCLAESTSRHPPSGSIIREGQGNTIEMHVDGIYFSQEFFSPSSFKNIDIYCPSLPPIDPLHPAPVAPFQAFSPLSTVQGLCILSSLVNLSPPILYASILKLLKMSH